MVCHTNSDNKIIISKTKVHFALIFIIIFLFAVSCKDMIDADQNILKKDISNDNQDTSGYYYPNKQGDQWKYSVLNVANGSTDELTVNITGQTTINDGIKVNIWDYTFRDSSQRNFRKYVCIINDTVNEWSPDRLNRRMYSYIIPFKSGYGWTTSQLYAVFNYTQQIFVGEDTCRTLAEEPFNCPAGNFPYTFKIFKQCWTPFNMDNYYENVVLNFVPHIGIISLTLKDGTFLQSGNPDMEIERWTLTGFNIIE
jgi:hypothetical protein